MTANKTSNTQQALWLMLSNFSSLALAFISAAILSRYFEKSEYGTYRQILYVYGTLQTIFTIGLPSVFSYFIPRYSHEEGKYFVSKINVIFVLLGVFFSVFLFFTSDFIAQVLNNEALSKGLKIFSIFPLFTLPSLGVEGLYVALKKAKHLAIYNTFSKTFTLICIIVPVLFFNGNVIDAIIGWGVASFITFLLAMFMKCKPYLGFSKEKISKFYSTVFNYSIPLMAASLVGFFIASSNQFFISRYYGTEEFAEFSNGFISIPIVGMVAVSVKSVLLPLFSKAQMEGTINNALKSYKSAVERVVLIILPLIVFCFSFSKEIMLFIYGDLYINSGSYFQVSLIRDVFHILPYAAVLLATGNSKIYFKSHLVSAVFLLPISFYLASESFSPLTIVIVFVIIEVLRHIYLFSFIKNSEQINLIPFDLIKNISIIVLQLLIVVGILKFVVNRLDFVGMPIFLRLTINFILFYILLISTQRIFGLNYLRPILSLIKSKL